MTLINPLWMFTHTNEFWKRRLSATEPASALELTAKTRSPARSAHLLRFTFMFLPFWNSGIPMPHRAGAERLEGNRYSTISTVAPSVVPTAARDHSRTTRSRRPMV
jgi:hypothetical protein